MNNGMAIYLRGKLLGYTKSAAHEVRLALRRADGVYAHDFGMSMSSWGVTGIDVESEAIAQMVFERFGKREPKSANAATEAQIRYLTVLGVAIEPHMTKARASQLIDAARAGGVGSVGGFYRDGSN
jgi:hypothetical protein